MTDENERYADAINAITEKLSAVLVKEYAKLPEELQKGLVLIKSSQLLLANVLCQVTFNRQELEDITNSQGKEITDMVFDCAAIAFAEKFGIISH